MENYSVRLTDAKEFLLKEKFQRFYKVMSHGTMSVEYFAPLKIDSQKPHLQDELYFIISGSGELDRNGELIKCSAGDVFFVPAQMIHRFINFTDDFSTWVIFYGTADGEESGEQDVL